MGSPLDRLTSFPSWQINLAGAALCGAVAGTWYMAGFTPLSQAKADRQALEAQVAEKRERLDHLAHVQAGTKASLNRAKEATTHFSLHPVETVLDQVAAVSRAAAQTGLTLDEMKPGQAAPRERFTTLPIHLSGNGAFPGLAAFMHTVRTDFPDMAIVGFTMRGEPEHPDKPAAFSIDLIWYAAKLPAQPAQPAPAPKK